MFYIISIILFDEIINSLDFCILVQPNTFHICLLGIEPLKLIDMRKINLTLFTLFIASMLHAQQFSFNLYITVSLGHSDTLVLGYDPMATDSIDAAFGEVDVSSQVWDSVFEARICPYGDWNFATQFQPAYETKKQIMHFIPQPPYSPYSSQLSTPFIIEIHSAAQRPYYLSWDSTLFADSSRNKEL